VKTLTTILTTIILSGCTSATDLARKAFDKAGKQPQIDMTVKLPGGDSQ